MSLLRRDEGLGVGDGRAVALLLLSSVFCLAGLMRSSGTGVGWLVGGVI